MATKALKKNDNTSAKNGGSRTFPSKIKRNDSSKRLNARNRGIGTSNTLFKQLLDTDTITLEEYNDLLRLSNELRLRGYVASRNVYLRRQLSNKISNFFERMKGKTA